MAESGEPRQRHVPRLHGRPQSGSPEAYKYIYIYIYTERERDIVGVCVYMYIYIYIYIYIQHMSHGLLLFVVGLCLV